ncbi:MAG TPA: 50S ribosomal protein L7ae-like protein [Clostridiales bacterium]|nr:50S ribosomal protein L7ae-like protein [Clostridiales bacterium]
MILTEKDIKNHNKVIGLRQVIRCIKSNQLWCVLIATDIDEHIKQEILAQCTSYGIPYVIKFTRKKLGEIANIDVKCATIGLLK